jgi:hypothetical protein
MIGETDNLKSLRSSPNFKGKATKENEKDETSGELKQATTGLNKETTCPRLQLSVATGLDRTEGKARKKRKGVKKDKKLMAKSLSTSETTNNLRDITIEKLVRMKHLRVCSY